MSNNPLLFNAAIAGASGGITTERWIVSQASADYLTLRNDVVAFATVLDAAIPTDATTNQQDAELLTSIVEQVLAGRGAPGDGSALALGIATYYNLLRSQLAPVPPETVVPLSRVLFVDGGTTTALADQDGSISTPFATVQQAALVADGTVASIYIVPANYTGDIEGDIGGGADATFVGMIAGLQVPGFSIGAVSQYASVRGSNITFNGGVTCGAFECTNCIVFGLDVETDVTAHTSDFFGAITVNSGGTLTLTDCEAESIDSDETVVLNDSIAGDVTAVSLTLKDSDVNSVDCQTFNSTNSVVNGSVECTSAVIIDCRPAADDITVIALLEMINSSAEAVTAGSMSITESLISGPVIATAGNLEIRNSRLASDIAVAHSATGDVTIEFSEVNGTTLTVGGACQIVDSQILCNLVVTGILTIDRSSYQRALNAGKTLTAASIVISDLPVQVKQIGYLPAGGSSAVLTLVPAGHIPGNYLVGVSAVVRTVGTTGTISPTISYSAPTIGAITAVPGSISITVLGSPVATAQRVMSLISNGVNAITCQYTAAAVTGGPPVVDLYPSATLVQPL